MEIWEVQPDGYLGQMIIVWSQKVEACLKSDTGLSWYHNLLVMVTEKLHGPFNSKKESNGYTQNHRVKEESWKVLEKSTGKDEVDFANIRDKAKGQRSRTPLTVLTVT